MGSVPHPAVGRHYQRGRLDLLLEFPRRPSPQRVPGPLAFDPGICDPGCGEHNLFLNTSIPGLTPGPARLVALLHPVDHLGVFPGLWGRVGFRQDLPIAPDHPAQRRLTTDPAPGSGPPGWHRHGLDWLPPFHMGSRCHPLPTPG